MIRANEDLFTVAQGIRLKIQKLFPIAELPILDKDIFLTPDLFAAFYSPCEKYIEENQIESEIYASKLLQSKDYASELSNLLRMIAQDEKKVEVFAAQIFSPILERASGKCPSVD